jgi:hypothetical protein
MTADPRTPTRPRATTGSPPPQEADHTAAKRKRGLDDDDDHATKRPALEQIPPAPVPTPESFVITIERRNPLAKDQPTFYQSTTFPVDPTATLMAAADGLADIDPFKASFLFNGEPIDRNTVVGTLPTRSTVQVYMPEPIDIEGIRYIGADGAFSSQKAIYKERKLRRTDSKQPGKLGSTSKPIVIYDSEDESPPGTPILPDSSDDDDSNDESSWVNAEGPNAPEPTPAPAREVFKCVEANAPTEHHFRVNRFSNTVSYRLDGERQTEAPFADVADFPVVAALRHLGVRDEAVLSAFAKADADLTGTDEQPLATTSAGGPYELLVTVDAE